MAALHVEAIGIPLGYLDNRAMSIIAIVIMPLTI